jgi:hypothetical protein
MPQSREESLRKKRAYAKRVYETDRKKVLAANRASRERAKAEDPAAYANRARNYNASYQARHPGRRSRTTKTYYWANRDACNRRAVSAHRKRKKSDPVFALTVTMRNRFVGVLQSAKCRPTTGEAKEIHRWFEWLRECGHGDWRAEGMEIDHVIPVSRFNKTAPGAAKAINNWRNLFPIPRDENRQKRARILPDYIRKVWRLADEFLQQ